MLQEIKSEMKQYSRDSVLIMGRLELDPREEARRQSAGELLKPIAENT